MTKSSWPDDIDPYRLRRALELKVERQARARYLVTGGLEPHIVAHPAAGDARCDCPDFAKGRLCKHLLAVRLNRGDEYLIQLKVRLEEPAMSALDLLQLWFNRRH